MTTSVRIASGHLAQTLIAWVSCNGTRKGDVVHVPPGKSAELTISGVDRLVVLEVSATLAMGPQVE